jgi:uncharacterized protein (TIGR02284 family)
MSEAALRYEQPSQIVVALNQCVEACVDGEKGYANASCDVRDPVLKSLFFECARQRAGFIQTLQETIVSIGGFPENKGTVRGAVHRSWTSVRLGLEGRDDRIVLEECIRGEGAALGIYEEALAVLHRGEMPAAAVRTVVVEQYAAIQRTKDEIRRRLEKVRAKAAGG